VIGESWTPYDGHANRLNLLHALHGGFVENRGRYFPNSKVARVEPPSGDFRDRVTDGEISTPKVVLAAGLGNAGLAPRFARAAPVKPQRADPGRRAP
jgi:hydrogen cyanide synthase HcnC